jgi:hypothetical protein
LVGLINSARQLSGHHTTTSARTSQQNLGSTLAVRCRPAGKGGSKNDV